MASWCDEFGKGLPACPRSRLAQIIDDTKTEFGIDLLVGFEIEVTFLRRDEDSMAYKPYTSNHAWGTLTPEQWQALDLLHETVDALAEIGVDVQQFHAESAPVRHPAPPCSTPTSLPNLTRRTGPV